MSDTYISKGPTERTFGSQHLTSFPLTPSFYEALVVDVVLDHTHPQYSPTDGYNVGSVKIRMLSVNHGIDDSLLGWADPMDASIQEFPLIGELVFVQKLLGNFFYIRPINVSRRIQENTMTGLNPSLSNRYKKLNNPETSNIFSQFKKETGDILFGDYFKPDNRVRQLKHFEGDVIIQGRMGNSIRFGSSKIDPSSNSLAPNIILRTGQAKNVENVACSSNSPFGLILEDINNDASSIWMTSDQATPFTPTTVDAGSFFRSLKKSVNTFDGAQIINNSDRIILNSKKTHIMLFSNEEIYLNSFGNTAIDTDNSILLTANLDIQSRSGRNIEQISNADFIINSGKDVLLSSTKKTSLLAEKLYIGSVDRDSEPMVGGRSLSVFLARLITVLAGNPQLVIIPQVAGQPYPPLTPALTPGIGTSNHTLPTGTLNPLVAAGLAALYLELVQPNFGQKIPTSLFAGAPFNSVDNFVNISNDTFAVQKNTFKKGKQVVTENNKWNVSDTSFYKVN